MFKKSEAKDDQSEPMMQSSEQSMLPTTRSRATATIGPSIQITGDVLVTGNQSVHIEGHVKGTISLSGNILSVGREGQVIAIIDARAVFVRGKVEGDLKGDEQVVIHSSGNVRGNIVAPRVILEDGCKVKGSIDMDAEPSAAHASKSFGRNEKVSEVKSAAGASTAYTPAASSARRQPAARNSRGTHGLGLSQRDPRGKAPDESGVHLAQKRPGVNDFLSIS